MIAQKQAAEKAGPAGKLGALLSTHPPDQQRVADLQKMMPQAMPIWEANRGKFQ
jgi:Zn-dependent protease with chaperone function